MNNIEKYVSVLGERFDALLLTSRYSRHYCARFDIAEGVAVVTKRGCRYFTDGRYIESAQKNISGFEVLEVNSRQPYSARINEAIADFGVTKLGYEEDYLTVRELLDYEKKLTAALVPASESINAFRAAKEESELAVMREAQAITDAAFAEVVTKIRAGMTEKQLCAELIYCLLKNGADGLAFDPIVVSGENTSLPHGVPGERKLRAGDFITMDFGALYCGYCADMTRTVALGFATDEMKRVYDTVLRAQLAGIAASHAGVTGKEVDGAAREVIARAGYGEFFTHSYGHSLGLEIHENPGCHARNDQPIPERAVCSAEPGIYMPGKFGVRIEDVVIFRQGGCEVITQSPKHLMIL